MWRAWWSLVCLSARRQGRSLQTLTAVVLILLLAGVVILVNQVNASMGRQGWNVGNFARDLVLGVYLTLVLPLLCLCFGTQALGGEWEERSLVWLLTRPIPRPLIYLAKFTAAVPWTLGCTLGGFFLAGACVGSRLVDPFWNVTVTEQLTTAGPFGPLLLLDTLSQDEALRPRQVWPGLQVVLALWPAILLGSLAYLALFTLLGAVFRRSTILGMAYAFLIEGLIGSMPGLLKRVSLAFYTKCYSFDLAMRQSWDTATGSLGIDPERTTVFLPVPGVVALFVLIGVTVGLVLLGLWRFSRKEFHDLT
jgi:ABC-type transport system involved in multi-copper enzyme maturation permease subunit